MPFLSNNIEHLHSFQWLVVLASETTNRVYFSLFPHAHSQLVSGLHHRLSFGPLACVDVQDVDSIKNTLTVIAADDVDIVLVLDYTEAASFLVKGCQTLVDQPTALRITFKIIYFMINIFIVGVIVVIRRGGPDLNIGHPFLPLLPANNPDIAPDSQTSKFGPRGPHLTHLFPLSIVHIKSRDIAAGLIEPSHDVDVFGLVVEEGGHVGKERIK